MIDYDAFRIALWYHDIIYNAIKKDNEEKSAEYAKKCLKSFNFDEKRLKIVDNLIKSTQKHDIVLNNNNDNAYLLDIDLSVLGAHWDVSQRHIQNIRKEYSIYPDFMCKKGCKNALYLDGFVSKTYLPEQNWEQLDGNFGVIITETEL